MFVGCIASSSSLDLAGGCVTHFSLLQSQSRGRSYRAPCKPMLCSFTWSCQVKTKLLIKIKSFFSWFVYSAIMSDFFVPVAIIQLIYLFQILSFHCYFKTFLYRLEVLSFCPNQSATHLLCFCTKDSLPSPPPHIDFPELPAAQNRKVSVILGALVLCCGSLNSFM